MKLMMLLIVISLGNNSLATANTNSSDKTTRGLSALGDLDLTCKRDDGEEGYVLVKINKKEQTISFGFSQPPIVANIKKQEKVNSTLNLYSDQTFMEENIFLGFQLSEVATSREAMKITGLPFYADEKNNLIELGDVSFTCN